MLKNSDGKKSGSYTIAWIAFLYTLVLYALNMIEEIHLANQTIKLRPLDSAFLFFLLTPAFCLYGFRRYTDKKFIDKKQEKTE